MMGGHGDRGGERKDVHSRLIRSQSSVANLVCMVLF